MKKPWIAGVLLLMILAGGCSAGGNKSAATPSAPQMSNNASSGSATSGGLGPIVNDSYDYEMAESYDTAAEADFGGYNNTVVMQVRPEKIIQTANIEAQTDRFDEVTDALRAAAPDHGGYVESANLYSQYNNARNTNYRVFTITLRVPTDKFEEVRRYVEGLAQVSSAYQSAEDVTAQYYDIAGRLETKKIEEERVLEMIGSATKIEDLLALEERLGEIRTQIERYQSQINSIDRLAAYSTIYYTLYEATKEDLIIVSDNLGGRIGKAFASSVNRTVSFFQALIIFLAGALIPLSVIALLCGVGIKTAKAVHHKQMEKNKNGSDSNEEK